MDTLRAHEIITVYTPNGNKKQIMTKYLVITSEATPVAVSAINRLGRGEVIHAQELYHIVIMENEHEQPKGH